jgi:Tol biopolymer transport system component
MGSDPAGTAPPVVTPAVKGPMYVAWSPDGTRLAFGGGIEAPYTMTIVDLVSGAAAWTQFAEGYPGEIKWSPDGTQVAVSTYDADRTRHEVYIVDPATGASRHVSSGCVIVWSPDGRFLAQHIEREPGLAIVDIATGEYGFLTREQFDTPMAWE